MSTTADAYAPSEMAQKAATVGVAKREWIG